jgi:hypothetical protein
MRDSCHFVLVISLRRSFRVVAAFGGRYVKSAIQPV